MADNATAAKRAADLIEAHDIHTVEVIFPDTWGILRGKRLPASQFAKKTASGLNVANAAFIWDPLCGIFEVDLRERRHRLSRHDRDARSGDLPAAHRGARARPW